MPSGISGGYLCAEDMMERIFDNPMWREKQRGFLDGYFKRIKKANVGEDRQIAREYVSAGCYPNGETISEDKIEAWRGVVKGAEWQHVTYMPWRKYEEHGSFIVANKSAPSAEEEREIIRMIGDLAFRTLQTLWAHDSIRGVYKWPRIIKIENYKGGGFPAYAWYARVVPR